MTNNQLSADEELATMIAAKATAEGRRIRRDEVTRRQFNFLYDSHQLHSGLFPSPADTSEFIGD